MNIPGTVIVVGGGLAGITAAIDLAERGRDVTVLESRPRLGGATYSFERGPLLVDTGQHVFLRCYRRYLELLNRLGVSDLVTIQTRLDVPVLIPGRPAARLRRFNHGPAPLHLIPALAGYGALSPSERYRAALGARALHRVDPDDPATDTTTFGNWLRRNGQGPRAIARLWGLLTIAALNIGPDEASLALAARVFRSGLLDEVSAGDIGVPRVPLARLHDRPAREAFSRLGIRLHTGDRARAVVESGQGLRVRTDSGELEAAAVVMAVPHAAAAKLVPEAATQAPRHWDELGDSPIVNVHVLYDRSVTELSVAAVLDEATNADRGGDTADTGAATSGDTWWMFDRTAAAGVAQGQYLVSSLSAAGAQIARPAGELERSHIAALARVLPRARRARVLDAFVTREPRATFRQCAGSARFRPPAQTHWPSLVLAGAWTATGWPDTMEGAVRSGLAAAEVLTPSNIAHHRRREVIV